MGRWPRVGIAVLAAVTIGACGGEPEAVTLERPVPAPDGWVMRDHEFRLQVVIDPGETVRTNRTAVLDVDFGDAITAANGEGRFDPESLRVVEVDDAGAVVDDAVPFQFDADPTVSEAGELVVLLTGSTPAGTVRTYDVYFDVVGKRLEAVEVSGQLVTTQGVLDEGNPSIKVATPTGTWFIRESSGGASSLVDLAGADWLAYNLAPEAHGEYRGMPNPVFNRGYFHPDFKRSPVVEVRAGPLRTTIVAETRSKLWQLRWEIYAQYAVVTMARADFRYYLMWEGLPGGDIDPVTDRVIRSTGEVTPLEQAWTGDIPGEEWVAFTDPAKDRGVFVAHPQHDDIVDSYRLMDNGMTVLGFGREDVKSYLEHENSMVVGLTRGSTFDAIAPVVQDAIRPLDATVGDVQVSPL